MMAEQMEKGAEWRWIGWPGELCGYQAAKLDAINHHLFFIDYIGQKLVEQH